MTASTYTVSARTTAEFGRVLVSARDQHLVIDGPVTNGCPGEAITPAEAFLAGVAACGVELIGVVARDTTVPLTDVRARIEGTIDRDAQSRPDVTTFNTVALHLELHGVSDEQGEELVKTFKGR